MNFTRSFKAWTGALCLGLAMGPLSGVVQAEQIDFDITDSMVVPTETFAAKVTVLGAAINSGTYDRPVTMQVRVGNQVIEQFGAFNQALDGNVNDGQGVRSSLLPVTFSTDTPISVQGMSWKRNSGNSGTSESHWQTHRTFSTLDDSPQIKVLRNGDSVPAIPGFQNQTSLAEFVQGYVDTSTNTVSLGTNEVIYLFELGTTNLNSSSADFQDLVVLITFAKTPAELMGQLYD